VIRRDCPFSGLLVVIAWLRQLNSLNRASRMLIVALQLKAQQKKPIMNGILLHAGWTY
jgi:hypothetical protein